VTVLRLRPDDRLGVEQIERHEWVSGAQPVVPVGGGGGAGDGGAAAATAEATVGVVGGAPADVAVAAAESPPALEVHWPPMEGVPLGMESTEGCMVDDGPGEGLGPALVRATVGDYDHDQLAGLGSLSLGDTLGSEVMDEMYDMPLSFGCAATTDGQPAVSPFG
jgi:hypothetical protein